jgi:hypothetical protein
MDIAVNRRNRREYRHKDRSAGNWSIADDGNQWIVQRRRGDQWHAVSFVRSTKAVLARCLREAGATSADINALLDPLPERHPTCPEAYGARYSIRSDRKGTSAKINAAIPKVIAGPVENYSERSLRAASVPLDLETAALNRQLNDWDRIRQETAWGRKHAVNWATDGVPSQWKPCTPSDCATLPDLSIPDFLRR